MAMTTEQTARRWTADPDLIRCVACHAALVDAENGLACLSCATKYPVRDGILVVKDQASDDNKIAADFYNSPLWPKFRFWEKLFWVCNGGERDRGAADPAWPSSQKSRPATARRRDRRWCVYLLAPV